MRKNGCLDVLPSTDCKPGLVSRCSSAILKTTRLSPAGSSATAALTESSLKTVSVSHILYDVEFSAETFILRTTATTVGS